MRYGLSMKQVCPLYRVQFIYGIILATDRLGLFRSLLFCAAPITIVDLQARSDRRFFGRDAPFCVLMARARDPCCVKRHLRVPGNTKRGIEPKFLSKRRKRI